MNNESAEVVIQTLDPIGQVSIASNVGLSPDMLTFMATVMPMAIFGVFTVLTINNVVNKRKQKLADVIGGFKVALIVSAIPIGLSLIASQTNLVSKAGKNPVPRNVKWTETEGGEVVVSWRTPSKVSGGYRLSLDPSMNEIVETETQLDEENLSHEYSLDKLIPEKIYYLEVFSDSHWYNVEGKPIEIRVLGKR